MKCNQCGTEYEGRFCPECGTKAGTNPEAYSSRPNPEPYPQMTVNNGEKTVKAKKPIYRRKWFIIAAVLIVIVIIGSIGNGEETDDPPEKEASSTTQASATEKKSSSAEEKETKKSEPTETQQEAEGAENGISADFKKAMDSYESFMDDYIDFMIKYADDPTDLMLLAEYADFMSKYAEYVDDFEKWEDEDLSDEELAYYIDVQARVSKKLLELD